MNYVMKVFIVVILCCSFASLVAFGPALGENFEESPLSLISEEDITVINAQAEENVILNCSLPSPPQNSHATVTWSRYNGSRVAELLTVGHQVHSRSDRYKTMHSRTTSTWSLWIKLLNDEDTGLYECQLTSHPPVSKLIRLNVLRGKAEIPGGPELYIKVGSPLSLKCEFRNILSQPQFVFWYQNNNLINYDDRPGFSIANEFNSSVLSIERFGARDSGVFRCEASNTLPASVSVHVLTEEKPAAMQRNSHSGAPRPFQQAISALSAILVTFRFRMFPA